MSYRYPKQIIIYRLADGTPIYETVYNEDDYNDLCERMDECRQYVRDYFAQNWGTYD